MALCSALEVFNGVKWGFGLGLAETAAFTVDALRDVGIDVAMPPYDAKGPAQALNKER